ncbi:MAG TPA: hypothetical protein VNO43_00595 [Candidatus Eisenbacteria bacterium]|nr:hypothetical protein [Candidatus Eisenbacteria bacterium]
MLNDLIKDYGEFIIPVSKAATEPSQPTDELPDAPGPAEPEFPLVENVAPLKPTVATPKDGDLDQRLKKLIKDYGEYDLYSDHSAKRTRAGIVAVCALLVLVIAAAYFYWRSSDDTPASSPQPVQSSLQPSSVEPATKSDHPANAEPSGFRRTANNPYATKHLKSVEKGGN